MSLVEKVRALVDSAPDRRIVFPFRAPTSTYPVAWLDLDAADAWESYPELGDVSDEMPNYLALANVALADDEHRCLLIAREAPHAAYVFEDGFQQIADSLDALFASVLLAPGASPPAPPPVEDDSDEAKARRLAQAVAAADWAKARTMVEAELSSWKAPEPLNELRITYARILAELGDRAAADTLASQHLDYLKWLASSEHSKAVALQAAFGAALAGLAVSAPGGRELLATIRAGVTVELPPPAAPGEVSADDIEKAVDAIRNGNTLKLRSLVRRAPAVVNAPEVSAALAEIQLLEDADTIQKIVDGARAKLLGG